MATGTDWDFVYGLFRSQMYGRPGGYSYAVRSVEFPHWTFNNSPPTREFWEVTSHGAPPQNVLLPELCEVSGGQWRPLEWSYGYGTLHIALASVPELMRLRCRRGQAVQLTMTPAWIEGVEVAVWTGLVRNLARRSDGVWILELVDLASATNGRIDFSTGEAAGLFSDLVTNITVGSNYTAGAASITLGGGHAGLRKPSSMTEYLILVTPTVGDPFYLAGTKSGTTYTITERNLFGTTDVDAVAGDAVQECYWRRGHPLIALMEILVSTGGLGNSDYDVQSATWGLGIPAQFIDFDAIEVTIDATTSPGADGWDIVVTERIDNPGGWLEELIATGGWTLAFARNQLYIAAALAPPWTAQQSMWQTDISDEEIVSLDLYANLSPLWTGEYGEVVIVAGDATSASSQNTSAANSPNLGLKTITQEFAWTDLGNWLAPSLVRLARYYQHTPEHIEITMAGLASSRIGPGDLFTLALDDSMRGVVVRRDGAEWAGEATPRWQALSVEVDWFAQTVKVVGICLPHTSGQWWTF